MTSASPAAAPVLGKCCCCGESFDHPDDLRPYGPQGALICEPCATLPENWPAAEARMNAQLRAVVDVATSRGGIIQLGGGLPRVLAKTNPETN